MVSLSGWLPQEISFYEIKTEPSKGKVPWTIPARGRM